MNIVAIDIGNTNITIGLFLDGAEDVVRSVPGADEAELSNALQTAWEKIPTLGTSAEGKRDGVIVASSVQPAWTESVRQVVRDDLHEKILVVGDDIPLPMSIWSDEPHQVGTDRIVAAAAAHAVVEDAVVVADFGTAVTIDLVDANGVFQGGVILPGFEIGAQALKDHTAQLPKVTVHRPDSPYGRNTADAINAGLYYAVIGAMEEIIRRYAEQVGRWPQTVMTGSAAAIIKDDCPFVDNYVPHLVIMGIVLTYQKYLEAKAEIG